MSNIWGIIHQEYHMDDRIFFHLSRTGNRLKTYMKNVFRECGISISPSQMGILFLLIKNTPQSMGELSRILELDNSAVTRLVDNLEKMRFVMRELNPEDRRQYLIAITEEGKKEITKAKKIVREANERIKQDIPENDLAVFLKVMNQICAKFER
jgi:DNA-binding MarR family transcriptional regulator